MKGINTPWIYRFFNPEYLICNIPVNENILYLTFDDGPVPEVTPRVLEILNDRNARATFFMVGDNVRKHPGLFREIVQAGHAIGNHTFHHLNGWKIAPGSYVEDVFRCEELFKTSLFRPPYGKFTPSQYFLLRKHYRFILWTVLTHDYSPRVSPEKSLNIAIQYSGPGAIVTFHDSVKASEKVIYALPRFLDHCIGLGYRFDVIPDYNNPSSAKL